MSGRVSWEGWAVPPGHEAVRAIAAETPDSELIRWVDEALREKSGYTLPPKIHIAQQDGDYYNVMPCIYERGNIAMVKMIGRHSIKRGRGPLQHDGRYPAL